MGDPASTSRNPAASMSLLQSILDSALDPGYRRLAEAEAESGPVHTPWWQKILLGITVAALAFGSVQAVRNLRLIADEQAAVTARMTEQVTDRQEVVAGLAQSVEELDTEVLAATAAVAPNNSQLADEVAVGSSFIPVSGPGVIVTIEDAPVSDGSSKGIVRDSDLRNVVNLLWQSGAEAIAVNDVRLGSTTTIRTAGSVILVDLQPIASPYRIQAIGDSAALSAELSTGDRASQLEAISAGAGFPISVSRASDLNLPGTVSTAAKQAQALN